MAKAVKRIVARMEGIDKRFGGVHALNQVSLDVSAGCVLGLIGENGAGKSTLMNVLSGMIRPDSGEVWIDGQRVEEFTPKAVQKLGVRIVHQEMSLLPYMTVWENIYLGREKKMKAGFVNRKESIRSCQMELDAIAPDIKATQMVYELSTAQRQLVEIVKSLAEGLKILIMDEPTSSLTDRETDHLAGVVEGLVQKGIAVIFISHKLNEIKRLCDSVTIMRDGSVVKNAEIDELSTKEMVKWMVGREVTDEYQPPNGELSEKSILSVKNLCSKSDVGATLNNVSFEVKTGEIVGMFGLIGAGRTETIQTLFGLRKMESGEVYVAGENIRKPSIADMIRRGVCWVPEDRRREGVCLAMSIVDNIGMPLLSRESTAGFVRQNRISEIADEYIKTFSIKAPSGASLVQALSGGNQQKVVLAKWLATRPKLLILDEPTRGIDIGSKSEIYKLIHRLRTEGITTLIISSEINELLGLVDRIIVMGNGEVVGNVLREDHDHFTERTIVQYAALGGEDPA